jgi:hypothetical protein
VNAASIPLFGGFTGKFQWKVLKTGVEKASGYNDINAVTGNIEEGTMKSTQTDTPQTTEDAIITCLFYDAGNGVAGLPNQDQCTITVTPTTNKSWVSGPLHTHIASIQLQKHKLTDPHRCPPSPHQARQQHSTPSRASYSQLPTTAA